MKRLLLLALIATAAWQAWKHYPELVRPRPHHEAVVRNHSKGVIERVRLSVGGQTFVRDSLSRGAAAVFPFRVTNDSNFELVWQWGGPDDQVWRGGWAPAGPMTQRHTITVEGRGVTYNVEELKRGEAASNANQAP